MLGDIQTAYIATFTGPTYLVEVALNRDERCYLANV